MHTALSVTEMQPYLGRANSCYKMDCSICDTTYFNVGSGKMYLSTEAEVTENMTLVL